MVKIRLTTFEKVLLLLTITTAAFPLLNLYKIRDLVNINLEKEESITGLDRNRILAEWRVKEENYLRVIDQMDPKISEEKLFIQVGIASDKQFELKGMVWALNHSRPSKNAKADLTKICNEILISKSVLSLEERLENEKMKRNGLKSDLKKLLLDQERKDLNKKMGRKWRGGIRASNHQTFRRPSPKIEEGKQRKLMVAFIPLTLEKEDRRNTIRLMNSIEHQLDIDFYFIVGKAQNNKERRKIQKEFEAFGDLLELPIEEGMNNGKTYHSFKLMYQLFGNNSLSDSRYDFFMKLDDDSFIFDSLVEDINQLPRRQRTYIGNDKANRRRFMLGRGYAVSEDLLEYISTDKWVSQHIEGHEDYLTGIWIRRTKHLWVSLTSPETMQQYSKNLILGAKMVHYAKTAQRYNDIFVQSGRGLDGDFQKWQRSRYKKDEQEMELIKKVCL